MAPITTREDLDLWQAEYQQIAELLDRIEQAERTVLASIGCPEADPVALYAILARERPAPWPKGTAERDKRRAQHAMFALCYVQMARRNLGPAQENARLAAYYALMAGGLAGDVVIAAADAAIGRKRRAAKKRASQKAAKKRKVHANASDAQIHAAALAYRRRHPYSRANSTRAMAQAIALTVRRKAGTVRSRLRALQIS